MVRTTDTLTRIRAFLTERAPALNERLPPERELGALLGVTRTELRKSLAILEGEGQIWRHVGRGTFIGARPVINLEDVRYLGSITSRAQILETRLALEPEIARLAALNGVQSDFVELRLCEKRCREAANWRVYEAWDYRFHYAIVSATKNKLLTALAETVNGVRRTLSSPRVLEAPPPNYPGFHEHKVIYDAIARRDELGAAEAMRVHLLCVRDRQPKQAG
jgi:GntR family uxuAB operon transcriptional repressor